jgi:hypothetical protein
MRVVWRSFCLALLLLPGACGKSSQSGDLQPMVVEDVNVDLPKLGEEFIKAPPELQTKVTAAVTKVRYKHYMEAMVSLDEVLNSPGLTDKQKKLLSEVISQLKEVVAKTPGIQ